MPVRYLETLTNVVPIEYSKNFITWMSIIQISNDSYSERLLISPLYSGSWKTKDVLIFNDRNLFFFLMVFGFFIVTKWLPFCIWTIGKEDFKMFGIPMHLVFKPPLHGYC